MSGASVTAFPLPDGPRRSIVVAPPEIADSPAPRDSSVVRLLAFGALAVFAAAHWIALLEDPPLERGALAVLAVGAGAVTLARIARAPIDRRAASGAAAAAIVLATAVAAVAIGLPARLLVPSGWGELANDLRGGLGALSAADSPYTGGDPWARLAILVAMPLWLGLAAALAFWPTRRPAVLRSSALVVLVAAYATAVTLHPPGAPGLDGLILLLGVAAWLWLPGMDLGRAPLAAAGVLAAGVLALPLAARLDGSHPWLDYRHWNWSWSPIDSGESFSWDHSYGPLNWTRTGATLLDVKSDAPHYWRTAVLDQFDGFRWLSSPESGNGGVELPLSPSHSALPADTAALNPRWVHQVTFTVRGLRSQLLVGAGAVISVHGLEGVAVEGLTGVAPTTSGLDLPVDHPLASGDSYTVKSYVPDPSAAQMRRAPAHYPLALGPYTTIDIPRTRPLRSDVPLDPNAVPSFAGAPGSNSITEQPLGLPLRSRAGDGPAAKPLLSSPYAGVYRLARRLTAGAPTSYDAVRAIDAYLRAKYRYNESPPTRRYPLRAFLLRDGIGYCQQFSGAMALMLRMVGIPARVATGFAPGTAAGVGTYVVRDLDAHSWVEVYFNGIGWVAFDPTPGAAPASSQLTGLGARSLNAPPTGKALPRFRAGNGRAGSVPVAGSPPGSQVPWWPGALILALAGLGGAITLAIRVTRARSLSPGAAAEARLRELESALRRVRAWAAGGTTLLTLERRLGIVAGPSAAAYVARLRAARYGPDDPGPPSAAERRALRRELAAGLGLRARARALVAIPPGGPLARPR